MGESWTPPPIAPSVSSPTRSTSIGCWIGAGCTAAVGAFLLAFAVVFVALWFRAATPTLAPDTPIASTPARPEVVPSPPIQPSPTGEVPARSPSTTSEAPSTAGDESEASVTRVPTTRLDIDLPTDLVPVSITPPPDESWNYLYEVQLYNVGQPQLRRGKLELHRAEDSIVPATARSHEEFAAALRTPNHATLAFRDSEYRSGTGEWSLAPTVDIDGTVVVLESGVPLVANSSHAGTVLPFQPVELLFMPLGDLDAKDQWEIKHELRGRRPLGAELSLAGRAVKQSTPLAKQWMAQYWPDERIAEQLITEEEVVATRTYRFAALSVDERFARLGITITCTYQSSGDEQYLATCAGEMLFDRTHDRILMLHLSGMLQQRDELRAEIQSPFMATIVQTDSWSRDQLARWTPSQTPDTGRAPTARPELLEQVLDLNGAYHTGFYRMSPDGRWLTCQSCSGTQLIDLDAEPPRVVEFWIGGEQHCYWDASSHAFARVSPGKLRTGSVFVELFQQDEQGDWPVEPIRTEVPNGLSFVCMAFDVKANQLLLFNRSEIVCLDLVTQRHRWTRQWSKPRPTSICWTDERIKILCGTKLVDLGQDTGEVIQELQLPDIETGRLVRDWSDRFSDEGRIVWLSSREAIVKVDAETGEELLRKEPRSPSSNYGFGPDSSWVLDVNRTRWTFFDPTIEEPWLTIEGVHNMGNGALRFSHDRRRVFVGSEGGISSCVILRLKSLE